MNLAFDLLEYIRARGRLSHPGQAQYAALSAPMQLEQDPRYRGYWYDPTSHTLVGVLLGLDLHRYRGCYHLLESNLTVALKPERRELYVTRIDPYLEQICATAKRFQFEQIVLVRYSWSEDHFKEIANAQKACGIPIVPASAMHAKGHTITKSLSSLPRQLQPSTMYVILSALSDSPIFQFLHHKRHMARWFEDELEARRSGPRYLLSVPAYDEPILAKETRDARWPNLVIKLSHSDKGRDVLMGRFESQDHARQVLGLPASGVALPQQFRKKLRRDLVDRLFPGALNAVYQPFVPPEVVDGRARVIRLLVFISPLVDLFLSAHGKVAGEDLPDRLPLGLVENRRPFVVGFAAGGSYCRLEHEIEEELRGVAREFGELARRAITRKFDTGPRGQQVASRQAMHSEARA